MEEQKAVATVESKKIHDGEIETKVVRLKTEKTVKMKRILKIKKMLQMEIQSQLEKQTMKILCIKLCWMVSRKMSSI